MLWQPKEEQLQQPVKFCSECDDWMLAETGLCLQLGP